MSNLSFILPPQPRIPGLVNWLGLWALTYKEIWRFTKILWQSVVAPLISTLLYYLVFNIAMGPSARAVEGVPYMTFLIPGLIVMSMAQGAFGGTSGGIVVSKIQGNIVDTLMAPLSPLELVLGYMFGGIIRALTVAGVSIALTVIVLDIPVIHTGYVVYHALAGAMMMTLLGIIGGIWANRFDDLAAVQNFIIGPATFLSGTFYSTNKLPEVWRMICHANPFFYMIDGFRYGFTGVPDGNLGVGVAVMSIIDLILLFIAWRMFASGYKLKS